MLRIVGVHRSEDPQREFVLLQNQGVLKASLKGHVLADDQSLAALDPSRMFSFGEEESIPAYCYAILITGQGINGWRRSADGSHVYHVYWNRAQPVWNMDEAPLHLLGVQHTNRPRAEGLLISR